MAARVDKEQSRYKYRDATGLQHFKAEIYADDTSDIAGVTVFENGTIAADPDSVAYVHHTGKLYTLDGNSAWRDATDGTAVTADD